MDVHKVKLENGKVVIDNPIDYIYGELNADRLKKVIDKSVEQLNLMKNEKETID